MALRAPRATIVALLPALWILLGLAPPAGSVTLKPGDLVVLDQGFGTPKIIVVDGTTGFQTAIPVVGNGRSLVVTPDGMILRTVGAAIKQVDPVTGVESDVYVFPKPTPHSNALATGLDVEDDGNLVVGVYSGTPGVHRVDPVAGTAVHLSTAGSLTNGVTVADDGDIYAGPELGQHIIRLAPDGTTVADYDMRPDFTRPEDLDERPNGEIVIVEETDAIFVLNPVTSLVTELVPSTVFVTLPYGVFAARDGTILVPGVLFGETDWGVYSIDPQTGAHTLYAGGGLIEQPIDVAIVETRPCDDGIDNDGDLLVDLADPGCADADDLSEEPDCDDGLDNDLDGTVDAAGDPGCVDAADTSELDPAVDCDDGVDDDGDGLADAADPGCDDPTDPDEKSAALVCDNGSDDDGDSLIDVPADPGCDAPDDATETTVDLECDNGDDDDGDGLTDAADPGCGGDPLAPVEDPACDDDFDNDNDGDADWDGGAFGLPPDPGCESSASDLEGPQCDDDLDNDGDGAIDWDGGSGGAAMDSVCTNNPLRDRERKRCGLGFELALGLAAWLGLRRRRARVRSA